MADNPGGELWRRRFELQRPGHDRRGSSGRVPLRTCECAHVCPDDGVSGSICDALVRLDAEHAGPQRRRNRALLYKCYTSATRYTRHTLYKC